MQNVNQQVWRILSKNISIQKDLQRGIINIRGLAKMLIKDYHIKASLDSVINSINRFESHIELQEDVVSSVLKGAKVMTRSNVSCVILKISSKVNTIFSHKLMEEVVFSRMPDVANIIGETEKINKIISLVDKENILNHKNNLSEIRIVMSKGAVETKGTLAKMVNELYALNINLEEMIVSVPNFNIYVKNSDFIKAHEAIVEITAIE